MILPILKYFCSLEGIETPVSLHFLLREASLDQMPTSEISDTNISCISTFLSGVQGSIVDVRGHHSLTKNGIFCCFCKGNNPDRYL